MQFLKQQLYAVCFLLVRCMCIFVGDVWRCFLAKVVINGKWSVCCFKLCWCKVLKLQIRKSCDVCWSVMLGVFWISVICVVFGLLCLCLILRSEVMRLCIGWKLWCVWWCRFWPYVVLYCVCWCWKVGLGQWILCIVLKWVVLLLTFQLCQCKWVCSLFSWMLFL